MSANKGLGTKTLKKAPSKGAVSKGLDSGKMQKGKSPKKAQGQKQSFKEGKYYGRED